MIYLDYSATTPVDERVLESFCEVSRKYIGNPNSLHALGRKSRELMVKATEQVASLLHVLEEEVIFTSSASESNNLALLGLASKYPKRNKLILTTKLEHSSILETVSFLKKNGFSIHYLELKEDGKIDLDAFEEQLKKEPLVVSIASVNSEVGVIQPIREIADLVRRHPRTFLHVDGTQEVGKLPVSLDGIDLYTFASHKIFGLKGVACLIKKKNVDLEPMIHGGKSQTIYRSGTPALPLIVSCAKALRLSMEDLEQRREKVQVQNERLRDQLQKNASIIINSPSDASPYILNISILGIKPETMLHALEEEAIYVSTKTACAKDSSASLSLLAMGKTEEVSSHSLRVSLSYLTTEEEINTFVRILFQKINELTLKRKGN